ncbi:MAG: arginase [Chlorobi bacterium]|nr:arginase [Chlorobiota bacterium]
MSKNVRLIGFPSDLGAGRRGVDMGPSALRIAGIAAMIASLGHRVSDDGDVPVRGQEVQRIINPKLKYLSEIVRASRMLAAHVANALYEGAFPIVLGGDHSLGIGSVAGVSAYCRERGKRVGVIWIDAHADMNTPETTPSGNIHGMPLAVAMGLGNHRLVSIAGFAPKVAPEHVALVGVRSVDPGERELIARLPMLVYPMPDIDKRGIHTVILDVLDHFRRTVDHVHVSFDLDSVDPSLAPGVGTPVSGGLTFREAHLAMEILAESGMVGSLDVAEVNPILDVRNATAVFASEIVASLLGKRIL